MLLQSDTAPTSIRPGSPAIRFSAALLKVASRCNLNCDYCYVYQHADQSWRDQPRFMSDETVLRFAERLEEYVQRHELKEFCVTFHGGEPLLYGAERLAEVANRIREVVSPSCVLDFSLQTNGTLLTKQAISQLEAARILVSVSLDGPKSANDRHRLDHGGESSFAATMAGINELRALNSDLFRGVIAVIDPKSDPRTLFEFFAPLNLPRLDFLLPDATHVRPPPGRANQPDLYGDWLHAAFTLWFREFPTIPIRWFDAALSSRLGVPSPTDAMGLGAVSLLVIDTDGTYTDHDVFKITQPGGSSLQRHLDESSFEEIAGHPSLLRHAERLTVAGLAPECRTCPVVEACGGGSVMHRWHAKRGLDAPSVYCQELFGLLETATNLLREEMDDTEPTDETFPLAGESLVQACRRWRQKTEADADQTALGLGIERNGTSAAAILLRGRTSNSPPDLRYHPPSRHWMGKIAIQSAEPWLVRPFSDSIRVLASDSEEVESGFSLLKEAGSMLETLDASLPEAMATLISDVIFVESTVETRDQIFSFSDDSAPNVLYISPSVRGGMLEADDFADSILHEFLHHVLYHLEGEGRTLLDNVFPQFPAPWRTGLRPAAGFFHGTFVFAMLSRFWQSLATSKIGYSNPQKAAANASRFREQAAFGIASLRQFALLTTRGASLLDSLAVSLTLSNVPLAAPGARA